MQNTVGRVGPKAWNDILFASVPYDALNMAVPLDTGLSGTTHRYRTLGHDPILGWIFGTSNILTDGLTKSDVITTYQVMDNTLVGLYPGGTPGMFASAFKTIQADPLNLPAALARQAIHFGSDYFTKQGLPIPFLGTLSPQMAHQFMNSNLKNSVHIDLYGLYDKHPAGRRSQSDYLLSPQALLQRTTRWQSLCLRNPHQKNLDLLQFNFHRKQRYCCGDYRSCIEAGCRRDLGNLVPHRKRLPIYQPD